MKILTTVSLIIKRFIPSRNLSNKIVQFGLYENQKFIYDKVENATGFSQFYHSIYKLSPNKYFASGKKIMLSSGHILEIAALNSLMLQQYPKFEGHPVFYKSNSIRKERLKLYPYVKETLNKLSALGVKIVGYTESAEENGFYRLRKLGIDELFQRVYVSDSQFERPEHFTSAKKTQIVQGKKPNPELIKQICEYEAVSPTEAVYIGDSMTKDIYMAKMAGVTAVLCKYPCDAQNADTLYHKLISISHWTEEDFQREREIRKICQDKNIQPDYTIDSFDHLIEIVQNNERL